MIGAEAILRAIEAHRVRYVVIGALGATLHGSPLRTEDLDICPDRAEGNLDALGTALNELGSTEWDPPKGEMIERTFDAAMLKVDKLWILSTDHGRLDLVFEPAGVGGYEELRRNAVELNIDDLVVTVASLEDIIAMKETAGRDKDLAQLPTLKRLLELKRDEET